MLKKQYLKGKSTCKVTFTLAVEAAPDAQKVQLLGDFNDWDSNNCVTMKRNGNEYSAQLELQTGNRYEFRYLIDGEKWENDWQADDYVPAPYLNIFNSVVEVSEPLSTGNPTEEIQEKAKSEAIEATKAPKAVKSTRPTSKKTAATGGSAKDDLTKIEGIGSKIAGLLHERGIMTFTDLAKAPMNILKETLDAAGSRFRMHNPTTWAEQAQLAAAGSWDALKRLQDELKGGKR